MLIITSASVGKGGREGGEYARTHTERKKKGMKYNTLDRQSLCSLNAVSLIIYTFAPQLQLLLRHSQCLQIVPPPVSSISEEYGATW